MRIRKGTAERITRVRRGDQTNASTRAVNVVVKY